MTLSIEAKVAAAVAIAFVGMGFGAIAQEGSGQRGQMSLQTSEASLSLQNASSENQLLAQY